MGFVVTWQELWMHVASGFGVVRFGLGTQLREGTGGSSQAISASIDTFNLVDQHR